MVVGPFMQLDIGGGTTADVFLLRFGPAGEALSPRTEQILNLDPRNRWGCDLRFE